MDKIGFALSFIMFEIGCICLFITALFDKTIPVIGKMASQLSETQSYSDTMYLTNYMGIYIYCAVIMIIGVYLCVIFLQKEKSKLKSFS